MARPANGQVVVLQRARGRVYALRFRAHGRRQYVTLGTAEDGWSMAKAQTELQNVLADVRRGIWHPPVTDPPPIHVADPTFHEFASAWLEELAPALRASTVEDYRWALRYHLLPFFSKHLLRQITVAEVDRYRASKVRQSRLNATSINKTLTRLGQILDVAEERELIDRNPMSVNRRRRKLRAPTPRRTYIDQAFHVEALLTAAAQLDGEARADQSTPRQAIIATLTFGGLRVGELLALRWSDVDLAAGRLRVGHSKTDAGIREVTLLPALREELSTLKATLVPEPDALVFGTTRGAPQSPTNIRQRVLGRAVKRANKHLAEQNVAPLPDGLTLHSLRRTYASILFAIGRVAPDVMDQLGHSDARLTLRVYARAMRNDTGEQARLKALVDGDPLGTIGHWPVDSSASLPQSRPTDGAKTALRRAKRPVEPTGIEPVTSCLQSRYFRI
jgi:integrase